MVGASQASKGDAVPIYRKRMRVLTNDYHMNLPGSTQSVKGGPQRFSRDFSAFAVAHGIEWQGIVNRAATSEDAAGTTSEAPGKKFFFVESKDSSYEAFRAFDASVSLDALFASEREELARIVGESQPDLVFVNGHSIFTWLLARAAFDADIPVVLQYAGIWKKEIDQYAELFSPASREACDAMERELAERAAANVFLNQASLAAFIESHPGATVRNPRIIPLPHAGWEFTGSYAPSVRTERVIGVVARWDRIKNHDAVLALAEEIVRRGLSWRIVAVTDIPNTDVRADFKKRYRELVTVVPPMERDALKEFYRSLDALILPSHFETAGGVVMEALAEGKPTLIAPAVGWADDYHRHGMDEWVADFKNPSGAVDALEAQFTRASWPEVEAFARAVQSEHSPDRVFSAYLSLFNELA